jgi:hypothetical protein
MSENPYEAPQVLDGPLDQPSEEERVRRTHLNAEASIRSLGSFLFVSGMIMGLGALQELSNVNQLRSHEMVATFGLPILLVWLGIKLRQLRWFASILAGVLAVLGLTLYPVGTVINLLILFFLFSKKGRFVVTPKYHDIIRATPHLRYRTSIVTWILLAILIALIVLAIFAALTAH